MTPDAISVASARLFAAGADPHERLLALKFLGVLMARADDNGRVWCDPDDLVGLGLLHDMTPAEVDRSRRWLEVAAVLQRRGDAWVIKNFSPLGDEVPPADAMDAIARALGRPLRSEPQAEPEPEPVVVPLTSPRSERRRLRVPLVPAGLVAAAAVVLALVLAGPASLRLPSQPASNIGSRAADRPPGSAGSQAGRTPTAASSPSTPEVITTSNGPGTAAAAAPPAGPSAAAEATCPTGDVVALVEDVSQQIEQPPPTTVGTKVPADVPTLVRTTVTGVLRNRAPAPVTVDPFPVDITFTGSPGATSTTVTAEALTAPATVPAGGTLSWSVSADGPPHDPGSAAAQPKLGAWRWTDAGLAARCPAEGAAGT